MAPKTALLDAPVEGRPPALALAETRLERRLRLAREISIEQVVLRIRALGGKVSRGELSLWERGRLVVDPEKEALFVRAYQAVVPELAESARA